MFCKKCKNPISRKSITGLCRHCRQKERAKKYVKKLKKAHTCLDCHKDIKPIHTFPNDMGGIKITKYPTRCFGCREKKKKEYNENKM